MIVRRHDGTLFQVHVREHHLVAGDQATTDERREFFDGKVIPVLLADAGRKMVGHLMVGWKEGRFNWHHER